MEEQEVEEQRKQNKFDLEARGGGKLPGISAPGQPAALTSACLFHSALFLLSLDSFMQGSRLCVG